MIRLTLQKPTGSDVAYLEATNANGARVIEGFCRWRLGTESTGADRLIRKWLGMDEHVKADPDAEPPVPEDPFFGWDDLDETEQASVFLRALKSYARKKSQQHWQEGGYTTKRAEADAELEPVEWA